jgi:Leucine-rich repeat (LRR) protein
MGGNRLQRLPDLNSLSNLEVLYVGGNAIREVPPSIGACSKLRVL